MTRNQIEETVLNVVKNYCESLDMNQNIDLNTQLIGNNRLLDSMGLVNVIVDLEAIFLENNIEISIMSETAMSNKISPFRTISSLSNFIHSNISNNE